MTEDTLLSLHTKLQLEEKMRLKVNQEYKEQITFQAERDLFVRRVFKLDLI